MERAGGVADGAGALVGRAGGVAEGADALVERAGGVADGAGALVERAGGVAEGADALVGPRGVADGRRRAGRTSGRGRPRGPALAARGAGGLLDTYQPIAAQAAPLARRFVQEFSEDELVAAIRLVDQLPRLTEHMESDIMPLLATLDRVGPDVHELLNQLREVRQAIQGIPGFRLFRRRGEEIDEDER